MPGIFVRNNGPTLMKNKNGIDKNKTLAVAMSGGVDSSVAAYLLAQEWVRPGNGGSMIGVSHFIWPESQSCNEETMGRAEAVCGKLGVPFRRIDMVDRFTSCVVDDFVETYLRGETPNPCVRCNERVRFGWFYRQLEMELSAGGEENSGRLYFATGHYVRTVQRDGRRFLRRGVDADKDQSYMLYKIDSGLLPYLRFPLGEYRKSEVVAMARKAGLPSASVKESQNICFISGAYPDFICRYGLRAPSFLERTAAACGEPGQIVDAQGNVLGRHRGYIRYTIGQRKGLGLSNGPWYVVRVDAGTNTVVVGRGDESAVRRFTAGETNWFIDPPKRPLHCTVKIRYNSPDLPCTVSAPGAMEKAAAEVVLDSPAAVTPGQSAVFYDGDIVLGGGIIRGRPK